MKKRIVIFASGSGSNAQNIIEHFQQTELAEVVLVLSNNTKAGVINRCNTLKVNCACFNKTELLDSEGVLKTLKIAQADLIVLAGFLLKFPDRILSEFPNRVINIHPALLPKYGGKGMYGMRVHEAVVKNKEAETGISIHYVNEHYDEGAIIFQEKVSVSEGDTPNMVAEKIHLLEQKHFPKVIETLLKNQ